MTHSIALIHFPIPRAVTAAVVAAIFGGCSSDSGVTSPPSARAFELSRIDGANLPYTIPNSSTGAVVTSATLRLWSDHRYTLLMLGNRRGAPSVLSSDEGKWAVAGASIRFSGGDFETTASQIAPYEVTALMVGTVLNSSSSSFTLLFTIPKTSPPPPPPAPPAAPPPPPDSSRHHPH